MRNPSSKLAGLVIAALLGSCAAQPRRAPAAPLEPRREAPVETPGFALGPELQLYPAGLVAALHAQVPLGPRDVLTLRAGWNATDRRDFGEHDDEHGGGPGGGVGWRHYVSPEHRGWLYGARVDLWALEIDWEDDPPAPDRGTTDVLVLQPTVEGGYAFRLAPRCRVDLTASLGAEINVDEDGEDVGEGAILLIGATFLLD